MLETVHEREKRNQRFFAAIQGIDLNKDEEGLTGDDIRERAMAKAAGMKDDEYFLAQVGIEVKEGDSWD